jgi:Mrp family chromosome partitioning ATPase
MDSGNPMTGPTFATPTASTPTPATPGGGSPNSPNAPKSVPPSNTRPGGKPGNKPDDGAAGLRVLTFLRLHWLMIVFCGTLIGVAGALLAWELLASKYESYSLLQVSSVPTAIANQNNPNQARTDFVTYLKTTSALIKSEFVLNAALRDIKDLPTIKAQSDPIKYLDEELIVTWQDGSEVIRITFKGTEPQDAKKIVDAVQNAFLKEVVDKDVKEKQKFLETVKDAQTEMKRILNTQAGEKAKPAVVQAAGTTPPAPGAAPGVPPVPGMLPGDMLYRINPQILINRLISFQQQVETLPLTLRDYKRREDLLKEKLESLRKASTPKTVEEMVDKDQDVMVEKIRMTQALNQWKKWESFGTPDAAEVLRLKSSYEAQKKRWEDLRTEKIKKLDELQRLEPAKKIAAELEEVIRAGQRYQEQFDYAKAELAKAEKQLGEIPLPEKGGGILPARFEDKPYSPELSQLEGTDSIYRRLVLQYYQTMWELNSPPRVKELQKASHPVQKDMKKQYLGTAFAGLMGFALMAMGVIAYESVTRRVSSLGDVKSTVPSPIVGVIPAAPGDATSRDPVKRAAANEAIDKLRAYVSQTWLSRGATAIAVTSAIGDEGKAFTAFGLASSLAQSGYKTLLVDFDLREPALHTYAGVANLAGVCELLRSETDMRSVVQFLPSGLHLLPAGKWSDEARKAATGEKLENVLAKMKEPYDCVVIHGHALLTVAESVEVARRCEVVLLCARYRETAMPLLKSATERVTTMEIPYTGVVYVGATEKEALC